MFGQFFYKFRRNLDMMEAVKGWEKYQIQYEKDRKWGYTDENTITIAHLLTQDLIQLEVLESREIGYAKAVICRTPQLMDGEPHVRVFEIRQAMAMPNQSPMYKSI